MTLTERPVLTDAGDALAKAERFAELSEQTADDGFETVIHGAYFAMFHAARAALLAVEGRASTDTPGWQRALRGWAQGMASISDGACWPKRAI